MAERVLERLHETVPASHFRPSCVVFDIEAGDDGVVVRYEDREKKIQSLHAKAVICACPKFVVNAIVQNLEPERKAAIARLRYNSYLVANALVSRPVADDFYDLFLIGSGRTDLRDVKASADRQGATERRSRNLCKTAPVPNRAHPVSGNALCGIAACGVDAGRL